METGITRQECGQLVISGYEDLPEILPNIDQEAIKNNRNKSKSKQRDKSRGHDKHKTLHIGEGNLSYGNINTTSKNEGKASSIPIESVKIIKEDAKFKERGLGVISTAPYKGKNEFMQQASDKDLARQAAEQAAIKNLAKHPYIRKSALLTDAEKKLYMFLKLRLNILSKKISRAVGKEVGDFEVMTKVRMADIVEVNKAITRQNHFLNKIAYKHIDFLILSSQPSLDIICAVELDDYTHEAPDRKNRDTFVNEVLKDCGIKLYRIGVRIDTITSEDTRGIEGAILDYYAPRCPKCGRPMEYKASTRNKNYGHRFYGCIGWYESGDKFCGETIDID